MSPDGAKLRFHEQLDGLQERLLEMSELVEHQVADAVRALDTRDSDLAKAIRKSDHRVDELEIEIDEQVVDLLALQQPMASDLRLIFASLTISNDLERIGDHAVSIARAVKRVADVQPGPRLRELDEMVEVTRRMLSEALGAYVSRDSKRARAVCAMDDEVDDLRRDVYRILVTRMSEDPDRISIALELLLVAQNLERIGDLSTNIAEDVVFLVEGKSIKHGGGLA